MSNLKESGVVFETGSIKSFFLRKKVGLVFYLPAVKDNKKGGSGYS